MKQVIKNPLIEIMGGKKWKKYKVTFYFEGNQQVSMIGYYNKITDLVSAITGDAVRPYQYFTDRNPTDSITVNINKVCYFKIEDLGADVNELY